MNDINIYLIKEYSYVTVYIFSIKKVVDFSKEYSIYSFYDMLTEINQIIIPNKLFDCNITFASSTVDDIFEKNFCLFLTEITKKDYIVNRKYLSNITKNYNEVKMKIIQEKYDVSEEIIKNNNLTKSNIDELYNNNDSIFLYDLACNYYYGKNIEQNIEKSINIFKKCVGLDNLDAIKFLANYYLNVVRNEKIARVYIKLLNQKIIYEEKFYGKEDWVVCRLSDFDIFKEFEMTDTKKSKLFSELFYNNSGDVIEECFYDEYHFLKYKSLYFYNERELIKKKCYNNNQLTCSYNFINGILAEQYNYSHENYLKSIIKFDVFGNIIEKQKFSPNKKLSSVNKYNSKFLKEKYIYNENGIFILKYVYEKKYDEINKENIIIEQCFNSNNILISEFHSYFDENNIFFAKSGWKKGNQS